MERTNDTLIRSLSVFSIIHLSIKSRTEKTSRYPFFHFSFGNEYWEKELFFCFLIFVFIWKNEWYTDSLHCDSLAAGIIRPSPLPWSELDCSLFKRKTNTVFLLNTCIAGSSGQAQKSFMSRLAVSNVLILHAHQVDELCNICYFSTNITLAVI